MKKLRRILAIVLTCAMALCVLTACSGSSGGNNSNSSIFANEQAASIAQYINTARKAAGKKELIVRSDLNQLAEDALEIDVQWRSGKITEEKGESKLNQLLFHKNYGYHIDQGLSAAYPIGSSFSGFEEDYPITYDGTYMGCAAVATKSKVTYFCILAR